MAVQVQLDITYTISELEAFHAAKHRGFLSIVLGD
jgi:hypothetical protein